MRAPAPCYRRPPSSGAARPSSWPQSGSRSRRIGCLNCRIPEHRQAGQLGDDLLEQLQSLRPELLVDSRQPRNVSTRSTEARHQPGLDRVHPELGRDNRYRIGRALGGKGGGLARRDNDVNFQAYQLAGQFGEPFNIAARVSVLDREVAPFDIAKVAQALLEFPRVPIGDRWRTALTEPTDSVDLRRRLCNRDTGRAQEDKYDRDDT